MTLLIKLGLPIVFLICLGLVIWIAVKSAKDLPKGKKFHKLSRKELKRMRK